MTEQEKKSLIEQYWTNIILNYELMILLHETRARLYEIRDLLGVDICNGDMKVPHEGFEELFQKATELSEKYWNICVEDLLGP